MESNKPFVEKETWGDCVERELGELPENESYTKQTVICAQTKVTEKEWETFLEPDNMQLENLTEISDIQTSDSTQDESFTQACDHQSSEDSENNPRLRHIRRGWTPTYNCPTHHQNNRQRFWNQSSAPPNTSPHQIRPQWTPHAGYQNPQMSFDNMQEGNFQRYHNSQIPVPNSWQAPLPIPPPYMMQINYLRFQVEYLDNDLRKNNISLSEQTEKRLQAEKKYDDCLIQLRLNEETLKKSKLEYNKVQEYLTKLLNVMLGYGNMEDKNFQLLHNSQIPLPMPYPWLPPPLMAPPYLRQISNLTQQLEYLQSELQKNSISLSVQTEKRLQAEQKYDDCLTQIHLYEEALKDFKEFPNVPQQIISVQIQTDLQETLKLKTLCYQAGSTQTEMDVPETRSRLIPVHQMISTQTETDSFLNVSVPETVKDPTVSLKNEIYTNEILISEQQQVTEEEKVTSKTQNMVKKAKTVTQQIVLETKTGNPQTVFEQNETNICKISEAESVKAHAASAESEGGPKEKQILKVLKVNKAERASKTQEKSIQKCKKLQYEKSRSKKPKTETDSEPQTVNNLTVSEEVVVDETQILSEPETVASAPQMKFEVVEDVISTSLQGPETHGSKELSVQETGSEQEEGQIKEVSLWRHFKKAMTPSHRRQYKHIKENRPQ
ncbi:uncharacterized protein LOC124880951 [Girardinichthys multiradiatus]|uniref:uncharacterized protein LOC124880951 n=1 Tax=Girardinichthys multiradiatus TaxID=208333 RepID=UPI001FAE7411|nr:uncharacterized protein LOC124880951 [Girardinichthys multiradiatus]